MIRESVRGTPTAACQVEKVIFLCKFSFRLSAQFEYSSDLD
jgi:hypothetical protein